MRLAELVFCWSARNVLDLHVDGRLTAGAAARVEAHLKACAGCRAAADELRPVPLKAGAVEVPPGLADSILRRLETEAEPAALPSPTWRLAPAQAAALVYLLTLAAGNAAPGTPSQGLPGRPGLEALR